MKTKTKIIIGSMLGLILLAVLAVVGAAGAVIYFSGKIFTPERKEKMKKAEADGIEFGKTTDQDGCMKKGFSLKPPTDSFDLSDEIFVKECLGTSRPTPDFCDGVPFVLDRQWFQDQCERAGQNTDACTTAFIAKRNYCVMDGKK